MTALGTILPTKESIRLNSMHHKQVLRKKQALASREGMSILEVLKCGQVKYDSPYGYAVISNSMVIRRFVICGCCGEHYAERLTIEGTCIHCINQSTKGE